ncbi:hypothetical protein Droror1_Dr00026932 [Drosera rotundifolia]
MPVASTSVNGTNPRSQQTNNNPSTMNTTKQPSQNTTEPRRDKEKEKLREIRRMRGCEEDKLGFALVRGVGVELRSTKLVWIWLRAFLRDFGSLVVAREKQERKKVSNSRGGEVRRRSAGCLRFGSNSWGSLWFVVLVWS